jgi:hypothetical protein
VYLVDTPSSPAHEDVYLYFREIHKYILYFEVSAVFVDLFYLMQLHQMID